MCIYVYMCICVYMYVCICMYIQKYIYVYKMHNVYVHIYQPYKLCISGKKMSEHIYQDIYFSQVIFQFLVNFQAFEYNSIYICNMYIYMYIQIIVHHNNSSFNSCLPYFFFDNQGNEINKSDIFFILAILSFTRTFSLLRMCLFKPTLFCINLEYLLPQKHIYDFLFTSRSYLAICYSPMHYLLQLFYDFMIM